MTADIAVVLPLALTRLFEGAPRIVNLAASDISEVLDALEERWPGMRDRLRDSRPAIRKHINVFVDGQRATLQTQLQDGAKVHILTAISGG